MLGDFWKGVGGSLLDRFATVATPAAMFWVSGLLAQLHGRGSDELERALGWLEARPAPVQVAVLATVLAAVAASGVVVARAATPVLRLLEGYWPPWADPLRRALADRHWRRATSLQESWDELRARVDDGTADARQRSEYARVERRLRDYPEDEQRSLPTLLGNVLRAAETRPVDRYGLDPVRTWAPLWLVLPETARSELTAARSALDGSVRVLIWSALLLVWSPFTWWAVAVAAALTTHQLMVALPARARSYGAVLEAAMDVHRRDLYDALRWPLPETPAQERAVGEAVTEYLWRGSDDDEPTFRTS